jgi:hypothetical protein
MSINLLNEDTHEGGADQVTAQNTGGVWALVSLFWKWVNANSLQNDVMIIVSHDFSRTAYNSRWSDNEVVDASGNNRKTVRIPGRDHDLSMGMMFINAGVPKSGRVGFITDTLTPVGTKDTKGTIDSSLTPYTSENMVGSMLMRVFPELYPTERMVRKHWPTFREIPQIIA